MQFIKKMRDSFLEFIGVLRYCLKLSWQSSRPYTVIRIAYQLISPFISFVSLYIGKEIINSLSQAINNTSKDQNINLVNGVIFVFVLNFVFTIIIRLIQKLKDYSASVHNDLLSNYINKEMMKKAVNADLSFFDSAKFYNDFEIAKRDSFSYCSIIWNIIDGIGSIITLVTAFYLLSSWNVFYTIILVISILPVAFSQQKYTKQLYKWRLERIGDERKMNYLSGITSSRAFAQDIRLFNIGNTLIDKYLVYWTSFFKQRKKIVKTQSIKTTLLSFIPEVITLFIILSVVLQIINGKKTLGDYTLYSGLIAQLTMGLNSLISIITKVYEDRLKISKVKQFEKIKNLIINSGTKILNGDDIDIEFRNVSFTYPETEKPVLKNINFKIEKSGRIGIVGVNGSGKTTIIKLILRFYDVSEGEILVNGINIKEYEIASLRKYFSSFFQQVANYSFTLRENIAISDMDKKEIDDALVLEAITKSDGTEFYNSLPKGLDTYMTRAFEEDGIELSGGLHQKIALARTFYRDSPVLILDEPSASLDPEAEYRIFQSLNELCINKTVILTSHRLSNITMMDKIIVIENNTVVEQGSHAELLKNNSRYAQLYNYQANKYKV